jgi:hypothetical protein
MRFIVRLRQVVIENVLEGFLVRDMFGNSCSTQVSAVKIHSCYLKVALGARVQISTVFHQQP